MISIKKLFLSAVAALMCFACLAAGEAFAADTLTAGEREYPVADGVIDLRGLRSADVEEAAAAIAGLDGVTGLRLDRESEAKLSWDEVRQLADAAPEAVISYEFILYGRYFNLNCETFDLNNIELADGGAEICSLFPLMRGLKAVNMDTCGIANEDMAALRDRYPQYDIFWRVRIADRYGVLTNAEMVLCSCPDLAGDITTESSENFKYCNKVKYLDLGHNAKMTDISFVRYMPELEVAILAINTVQDFSPLADCPKLEYLELFNTGLSDLSPLSKLKNLKHLNICYDFGVSDISPLFELPQLERLWIGKYDPVSPEQIEQMQKIAPNCEIDAEVGDPTNGTWRINGADAMGNSKYAERYALLRKQFDGYTYDSYSIDPKYYYGW